MSEEQQDVTPELIEFGVAIAIGYAGARAEEGASEEFTAGLRSLWPEELSADALELGSQVALALMAWFNINADDFHEIHPIDLLEFSQSLMPNGNPE